MGDCGDDNVLIRFLLLRCCFLLVFESFSGRRSREDSGTPGNERAGRQEDRREERREGKRRRGGKGDTVPAAGRGSAGD